MKKPFAFLSLVFLCFAVILGGKVWDAVTYDPSEKAARKAEILAAFNACVEEQYEQTDKGTVESLKSQGRAWQNLEHNSRLWASEICGEEHGVTVSGDYRF